MNKTYLGDSVYAEFTTRGLELTTENGLGPTNTIVLEPMVLEGLLRYLGDSDLKDLARRINTVRKVRR